MTTAVRRKPWFGPATSSTCVVTLFVNATPFLIAGLLGVLWLIVVVPCEVLIAAVLCRPRGPSRHIGTGIFVALGACLGVLFVMSIFAFVSDRV